MDTRRIAFDWLLKNQPETIAQLRQFLKASGISEKAYADAFVLLFNTQAPSETKVTYIATTNQWQTGTKIMSDAKLFVSLSKVCEVIHDYVLNEWQEFLDYTEPVEYQASGKKDTTWLGRFTFEALRDFSGMNRILTILARGFLFHDSGGVLLPVRQRNTILSTLWPLSLSIWGI